MSDYIMIMTTTDKEEEAKSLSCLLVENKLAACVQVSNIKSYYVWQGKFENTNELILYIKTKKSNYNAVQDLIVKNHSYDTPEIIAVPIIQGLDKYINWMNESIKNSD